MAPLPIHHGASATGRITMSPSPSQMPPGPKGRGVAGATCSCGTPVLLVSSPSPSSAAGCPFIPCQHRATVLPISIPSYPSPTAAAPMGISRTGPAIPGCCRRKALLLPRGLPPWGFPSLAPFPQLFAAQREGSHPGRAGTAPWPWLHHQGCPGFPSPGESRLRLGMQQGLILAQRVSLQQTLPPAWF